jgi:hypothetical protein
MNVLTRCLRWLRRDRFTPSYFVRFLALFLLFASLGELDAAFTLYLMLAPLLLVVAGPIILFLLFAMRRDTALRRWKRLASWIAGLFLAVGVFYALAQLGLDATWARLALTRDRYERVIAGLPQTDDAPRFKMFEWGDTGGAGVVNIFRTLIYDESDEIALESEQRSLAWRDRMIASEDGRSVLRREVRGSTAIRRISGHFYLLTEVDQ